MENVDMKNWIVEYIATHEERVNKKIEFLIKRKTALLIEAKACAKKVEKGDFLKEAADIERKNNIVTKTLAMANGELIALKDLKFCLIQFV